MKTNASYVLCVKFNSRSDEISSSGRNVLPAPITSQFLTLGNGRTHGIYSIFLVYRNNCEKHDTPVAATPLCLCDSPLCMGLLARKVPEAPIVGATALRCEFSAAPRIDHRRKTGKKGRRNVGPSLWNYVTVN